MRPEDDRWSRPSLLADLRDAVRTACDTMAGERIGAWVDGRWNGGLNLIGLDMPGDGPEEVTIATVGPELDTVTWDWVETLEGDTQVGMVEVDADVRVEDRPRSHPARLRWRVTADPGQPPEMEFDGAIPTPQAPDSER